VPLAERDGVYVAQRRFGTGEDSVVLEAHFAPDGDRTHALIKEAVASGAATPELTGAAA
jgi:hypothetical protein